MDSLIIQPTYYTPHIILNPDGIFTISGKAMTTKTQSLFRPVMKWLNEYSKNPASITVLNIDLEILHVDCLVKVMEIGKILARMTKKGHKTKINWYYDKDDEDMKDLADMVTELLDNVPVSQIINEKDPV